MNLRVKTNLSNARWCTSDYYDLVAQIFMVEGVSKGSDELVNKVGWQKEGKSAQSNRHGKQIEQLIHKNHGYARSNIVKERSKRYGNSLDKQQIDPNLHSGWMFFILPNIDNQIEWSSSTCPCQFFFFPRQCIWTKNFWRLQGEDSILDASIKTETAGYKLTWNVSLYPAVSILME